VGQADREGDLTTGRHSCQEVCQDLLLDVFPRLPMNDAPDGLAGEAPVTSPEFRHGGAGCIRLPDGTNVVFGEVGFVMVFAARAILGSITAPFLDSIGCVRRRVSKPQVIRADTGWVIAVMADMPTCGDFPVRQVPRGSVGQHIHVPTPDGPTRKDSVTVVVSGGRPQPTSILYLLHFCPEAGGILRNGGKYDGRHGAEP